VQMESLSYSNTTLQHCVPVSLTRPMKALLYLLPLLFLSATTQLTAEEKKVIWPKPKPTTHDYSKWEKDVAKFEKADKASPPEKGGVLFVGSSTIVRWKTLAADFPELKVLNRGFGGNQIKDSTHYAERIIFPYQPSKIVLRAGGNDINAGWPVEDVFQDYVAFVKKVREQLPEAKIFYVGLCPTLKRKEQIAVGDELNAKIEAYCKANPGLFYIDTRSCTLGENGQPDAKYLDPDLLHLSKLGYQRLAAAVRPVLLKH
jgi:lysophospholipase L1-like esterase